ncbi:MAG: hydrogenase [Deltaproteobacteria bacterium]|nr:hydrogenase [Deltaproteobacteria bacterium]
MIAHLERDTARLMRQPADFFGELKERLRANDRVLTLYSTAASDPGHVTLTAVTTSGVNLQVVRTELERSWGYHSLTRKFPALHIFEREIFERDGVPCHDHPWLKPVRYPPGAPPMAEYPFYKMDGKELHEVGVGPVHAGVIEPGHFRFSCLGEQVHHLEIQLGYQHRGAEALLQGKDPRRAVPLVETISGDASIAHAWAFCAALEALADVKVSPAATLSRGMALELERVAMHLAGLSGMMTDIGFLPGGTSYGRLRTTAINTSMLLSGSRFGRGWIRPGGARAAMSAEQAVTVKANLELLVRDLAPVNALVQDAASVRRRLQGTGTLTTEQAQSIGLVGMAARMCNLAIDWRTAPGAEPYTALPIATVTEPGGDCWARGVLRIREMDASLRWLREAVARAETLEPKVEPLAAWAPSSLAVGICEGWRGEVVYTVETDAEGKVVHQRAQDPSLRNWLGLALAVRENEISDFPICNKSFDLSYCGNDL